MSSKPVRNEGEPDEKFIAGGFVKNEAFGGLDDDKKPRDCGNTGRQVENRLAFGRAA